jgi:hypothetical protein
VLALFSTTGCSLVLDFSDSAVPVDAPADAAFTQEECDFKEPNNAVIEAALFDVSEVGPAAVCERELGVQDTDFYKFTVPAGITNVRVRISFTTAMGDLDLKLYDSNGTELGKSVGFSDTEEVVCPSATCNGNVALPPADYLFEVFAAQTGGGNRYDISLTLTP